MEDKVIKTLNTLLAVGTLHTIGAVISLINLWSSL